MKIAILGSGLMGAAIGRSWAEAGHEIIFAYSRSVAKLERLARDTGGRRASVPDAVGEADVILFAVHWAQVEDVLAQAGPMVGKVVLNCCVPLDEGGEQLVFGPESSGAETLAQIRPDAHWVCCFNTVPSESFAAVRSRCPSPAPHVLVYGDAADALVVAQGLVRDAGFAPLRAGGLRTARYAEPFAMVTAVLAYGQPGGPALTYRFDKL